jgi:hypothetical protein
MHRFSYDGRRLHVFDRASGKFRVDVPRNVAVESEFNTLTTKTGEKQRFPEARLAELDDAAIKCADKLEHGDQLTREERWGVSFFLGFAETRGRGFRDTVATQIPKEEGSQVGFVDEKFAEAFSAAVGVTLEPRTIERMIIEDTADVAHFGSGMHEMGIMIEAAFLSARYCFWSDWLVASAPNDLAFVTSDRPVGLLKPGGAVFSNDPFDVETIKVLPLSPKSALFVRPSGREDAHVPCAVMTPEVVRIANVAVAKRSDRCVIAASENHLRQAVTLAKFVVNTDHC